MNDLLLVIDVGNTHIVVGLFDDTELVEQKLRPSEDVSLP